MARVGKRPETFLLRSCLLFGHRIGGVDRQSFAIKRRKGKSCRYQHRRQIEALISNTCVADRKGKARGRR